MRINWFQINVLAFTLSLSSCAYHFQGSSNPLQNIGIRRIYVTQFKNESYRPGIEHVFTAAMVREIEKSKIFELVDSEKKADAVMYGVVTGADASASSTSAVTVRGIEQQVAAQYSASISCAVSLIETNGKEVYSHTETQSKLAPGYSLTGKQGQTVQLNNESEQRLAYQYLAAQMMSNTYQNMVDIF